MQQLTLLTLLKCHQSLGYLPAFETISTAIRQYLCWVWANKESGGKRLSGKTRKGNPWLRQALIEVAYAASKTKDTY